MKTQTTRPGQDPAATISKRPSVRTIPCVQQGCEDTVAEYSKSRRCRKHKGTSRRLPASRTPRGEKLMPGPDGLTAPERQAKHALEQYWADRRRRGIPEEGTLRGLAEAG